MGSLASPFTAEDLSCIHAAAILERVLSGRCGIAGQPQDYVRTLVSRGRRRVCAQSNRDVLRLAKASPA
jgi:hypothetical protein